MKDKCLQSVKDYFASIQPSKKISSVDFEALGPLILLQADEKGTALVVVPQLNIAESLTQSLLEWNHLFDFNFDIINIPEVAKGSAYLPGDESQLSGVLYDVIENRPGRIFISTVSSLLASTPAPSDMKNLSLSLIKGEEVSFHDLLQKLLDLDYDDEEEVTTPGEFSRRGGLVDIYSPSNDMPVRLDFWGDEIESLRLFDPASQRTYKDVESYSVIPRAGISLENSGSDFFNYVEELKNLKMFIYNPSECRTHVGHYENEEKQNRFDELNSIIDKMDHVKLFDDIESADVKKSSASYCFPSVAHIVRELPDEADQGYIQLHQELVSQQVFQWIESGYKVVLVGKSDEGLTFIKKWCGEFKVDLGSVSIVKGDLTTGVIFPKANLVTLTERELFTLVTKRKEVSYIKNEKSAQADFESASFADLDEGDYVVHIMHGIGQYHGIEERKRPNGCLEEVLILEYADDVMVYVPVYQVDLITRYIGSGKGMPKLCKVGGKRWSKAKVEAEASVRDMAADMMRLQAVRSSINDGFRYPEDDTMQNMFESAFPYTETADQAKASAEIKADMSKSAPMDRLLCGDVGYGKTEVAMRAAFKAVMCGKQVGILVPTTILAQQHFYSFSERFAEFPVVIEMLSRFRTKKEQSEILERVKSGGIDIVIGTHRIVSKDVKFNDLGLVVVDEEQRFGVAHKERLKHLRTSVDVLTMTATPIPRTLYMGMTGLRDLSTIVTAPQKRLPVKTVVTKFDDLVIGNAIEKEVQRGGQVFFLHNRVRTIHSMCVKLQKLVPDAKIAVGHGQMDERELEVVMGRFIEGKIDVLVSTTIVESGVDIPNANTIIIDRADRFGLAELYQLRGRVGRWTRQAYAYLLLPEKDIITGDAKKRISAIRRYTHLGAGFKLAMRDLEIRGAGNLIGSQQSGHIKSVGFELYCQLLRSTVASLKGLPEQMLPHVDISLPFLNFVSRSTSEKLGAGFSKDYISSERLRLEAYRKLSACTCKSDIDSLYEELEDRYGKLPAEGHFMLKFFEMKIMLSKLGAHSFSIKEYKIIYTDIKGICRLNGKLPVISADKPHIMFDEIFKFLKKKFDKTLLKKAEKTH